MICFGEKYENIFVLGKIRETEQARKNGAAERKLKKIIICICEEKRAADRKKMRRKRLRRINQHILRRKGIYISKES